MMRLLAIMLVMNIVGAAHKPFYDLYLGQSPDVQVVDAATVLGTD